MIILSLGAILPFLRTAIKLYALDKLLDSGIIYDSKVMTWVSWYLNYLVNLLNAMCIVEIVYILVISSFV